MKYAAAICLEGLARLAPTPAETAGKLLGLADRLQNDIGAHGAAQHLPNYDRVVANLRNTLGEAAFAMAWDTGHTMSLDEALDEAHTLVAATSDHSLPDRGQPMPMG